MRVKGIRCIGIRTDRISEMRVFATEVLGLRVAGQDTAWLHFRAPDGHVYELTADRAAAR